MNAKTSPAPVAPKAAAPRAKKPAAPGNQYTRDLIAGSSAKPKAPKKTASGLAYPSPILGIVIGTPSRVIEGMSSNHARELTAARNENMQKANNAAAAKVAPLAAEEKAILSAAKQVYDKEIGEASAAYTRAVREAQSALDKASNAAAEKRYAVGRDATAKFSEGSDVITRALKQTRFMLEEDTKTALAEAQTEFEKYHAAAKAIEAERMKVQAEERAKREKAAADAVAARSAAALEDAQESIKARASGKTAAVLAAAKAVKAKGGRVLKAGRDGKITDVTESV